MKLKNILNNRNILYDLSYINVLCMITIIAYASLFGIFCNTIIQAVI